MRMYMLPLRMCGPARPNRTSAGCRGATATNSYPVFCGGSVNYLTDFQKILRKPGFRRREPINSCARGPLAALYLVS